MKFTKKKEFLFKKSNFKILFISIIIITIGFALMIGGESTDPNLFNKEIFNFQRIRLAPILIISGFSVAIISILKKPQ